MAEEVMSQWVVRLPDRLVLLKRPLTAIRVFSTDEVLQFKLYYATGTGDTKARIEQQQDINSRQNAVTFAYWVVLFPLGLSLEVLCCTVQRETADRILDSLAVAMFSNCGDNTAVDLRGLLAADLVTPEQVTAAASSGRFVDLGDGEGQAARHNAVAAGSVSTVSIPIDTAPVRGLPPLILRGNNATATGRTMGQLWTPGDLRMGQQLTIAGQPVPSFNAQLTGGIGARVTSQDDIILASPRPAVMPMRQDITNVEQVRANPADLTAMNVQSIGRGMNRNNDVIVLAPQDTVRTALQLTAAMLRQQPENRNTVSAVVPLQPGADYSEVLQATSPVVPPDNDAVDRVDPGF